MLTRTEPLTADLLKSVVTDATSRDCTADGLELRTSTTDWIAAAEALSDQSGVVVTAEQLERAVESGTQLVDDCGSYETEWPWVAACLADRLEQDRELGSDINTQTGDQ